MAAKKDKALSLVSLDDAPPRVDPPEAVRSALADLGEILFKARVERGVDCWVASIWGGPFDGLLAIAQDGASEPSVVRFSDVRVSSFALSADRTRALVGLQPSSSESPPTGLVEVSLADGAVTDLGWTAGAATVAVYALGGAIALATETLVRLRFADGRATPIGSAITCEEATSIVARSDGRLLVATNLSSHDVYAVDKTELRLLGRLRKKVRAVVARGDRILFEADGTTYAIAGIPAT